MNWLLISDDGATATHSMMVPGGTLYKITRRSSVALCFAPMVSYVPVGSEAGGSAGGYSHTFTQLPLGGQ